MENMLPGNSFPQICVVSVDTIVENEVTSQDYLTSIDISNHLCLLISNVSLLGHGGDAAIALTAFHATLIDNSGGLKQLRLR